jgi:hypothetical protein
MNFKKVSTICEGKTKEYTGGNAITPVIFVTTPSLVYA